MGELAGEEGKDVRDAGSLCLGNRVCNFVLILKDGIAQRRGEGVLRNEGRGGTESKLRKRKLERRMRQTGTSERGDSRQLFDRPTEL